MKNKIFTLIRISVSLGLLGLLFWLMRSEFGKIWGTLYASDPWVILLAVVLYIATVIFLSYRLKLIFAGENLFLSFWESVQLTYIGYFFNNFLPTAVGGDVMKAHYASTANQKRMQSYASVFMDRFLGLYSFLIIAAGALIINREGFQITLVKKMVFVFLIVGVAMFLIITNKTVAVFMERFFEKVKMFQLGKRLEDLYGIVHDYRNRRDIIAKAIMVSFVGQCVYFIVIYLLFAAVGQRIGIGNVFLIMPVVTFISMFPSLGGLGVREGAMVALFAPLAGKENAFAASLLLLFLLFIISFIGGIIYFWWGFIARRKGIKNG
ncbi:MAG: lysylphosphatidylglycerol synthase transmembrane domain-containing protein [Candidatus Omnitrophota bacterium]